MSAEKMVSEREAVERERKAFDSGTLAAHMDRIACEEREADYGMYVWSDEFKRPHLSSSLRSAVARYPLPKLIRPRVVKDTERFWEFRVLCGKIQTRWTGMGGCNEEWGPVTRTVERIDVTAERVALWADLLATPTEEVEDGS